MTTAEQASASAPPDGLVCAYVLDGQGRGRPVGWDEVRAWHPDDGVLWVHLDRHADASARWVREESDVDEVVADALLVEGSRPRIEPLGDALLMNLRGVNLNPGADPEDMVALRMWVEPARLITLRHRRLMAAQDVREALDRGTGPATLGALVVLLASRLVDRMGPALTDIEDTQDELELGASELSVSELRRDLSSLRRQAVTLRRHIAPQREVMARLQAERVSWLDDRLRLELRELQDRITRYVEDLDASRERASITQEELAQRIAEQTNRGMYILSIVAAIFLPLSLLTGLLGINVGGIPGATASAAFAIVVVLLGRARAPGAAGLSPTALDIARGRIALPGCFSAPD